jgi:hypothetical protein
MIFSHVLYRLSYLGTSRYSSRAAGQKDRRPEYRWRLTPALPSYNRRKEGPVTLRFVYSDPYALRGAVHEPAGSQPFATPTASFENGIVRRKGRQR